MRWIGLVVAAAAGCGFHPTGPSASGDDDDIMVDAPPEIGDRDSDGVLDDVDNCPDQANPGQANEDGDAHGDVCDPCPHLAPLIETDEADDDGDGIGNQCDPHVGTDHVVVFLPFNDPHELDAFEPRAGILATWSISGGQLHAADPALSTPQQIVLTKESIAGDVWVDSTVHIDSLAAGNNIRLAAVTGAYDDSGSVDMYACGLRADDAGVDTVVAAWHFITPPYVGSMTTGGSVGSMAIGLSSHEQLITATHTDTNGSDLICAAGASKTTLAVGGYVPRGYPGMRVLGATASYDYLFVVAIGIP
ncbi:MAG: hypothetical protein ABI678_01825 [Kofleriaceae bacterium]